MLRAALIAACLLTVGCSLPPVPNGPTPGPAVPVAQPSADMQRIMSDLQKVMAGKPQAAEFGADWRDLHAVIVSGGIKVDSNQRLRNVIDRFSLLLITQRYSPSSFDGFHDALSRAITAAFTDENTAIDPAKAADFILGIAWACGG